MRITEALLRKIIREELDRMDEMPYAGSLDPVDSGSDMPSFTSDLGASDGMNKPGAERFAKSGRFKNLAVKHFAHIPYDVWIAPMIGVGADVHDYVDDERMRIEPLSKGIETLRSYGFKVPEEISPDDVVILYTTVSTTKDTLATPWMIFHAMLDNINNVYDIAPSFGELRDALIYGDGEDDPDLAPIAGEDNYEWHSALTMASARNSALQSTGDALAEIMCQELLTTKGFVFNPEAVDPEIAGALGVLRARVKKIAEEFRRNIKGKLIVVAVN
jgi:hypothetical protein